MKTERKDIAYYTGLPYTKTLRRDQEGDVVAKIVELPGCSAHGASEPEALQNLAEAQRLWLEDCIEAGDIVPEPAKDDALPSGKWLQRVPRTLHRRLSQMALDEGVSLNQLVTSMLSASLSAKEAQKSIESVMARMPASRNARSHVQKRSSG